MKNIRVVGLAFLLSLSSCVIKITTTETSGTPGFPLGPINLPVKKKVEIKSLPQKFDRITVTTSNATIVEVLKSSAINTTSLVAHVGGNDEKEVDAYIAKLVSSATFNIQNNQMDVLLSESEKSCLLGTMYGTNLKDSKMVCIQSIILSMPVNDDMDLVVNGKYQSLRKATTTAEALEIASHLNSDSEKESLIELFLAHHKSPFLSSDEMLSFMRLVQDGGYYESNVANSLITKTKVNSNEIMVQFLKEFKDNYYRLSNLDLYLMNAPVKPIGAMQLSSIIALFSDNYYRNEAVKKLSQYVVQNGLTVNELGQIISAFGDNYYMGEVVNTLSPAIRDREHAADILNYIHDDYYGTKALKAIRNGRSA